MNIRTIGIIGVGGVGGYFGGKLCRLPPGVGDLSISFVARGEHLRAIQQSGLQLSSESDGEVNCRPTLATNNIAKLPPLDLCLVCVKEFDLPGVLSKLRSVIHHDTLVLPLLNGVDVYDRVRAVIERGVVLPACVYVGTHIDRPGRVVQRGGACKILLGPDPRRPVMEPAPLIELFSRAAIKCAWTIDIRTEIWTKFIFIAAFGLVSAANDKTLGEIMEDNRLKGEVESVMIETLQLARSFGIPLPTNIIETSLRKGNDFPYEAKTSLQRDVEQPFKQDERDLFVGTMLRLASKTGVDVPTVRTIADALQQRKPV